MFVQLFNRGSRWWFSCPRNQGFLIVLHDGIKRRWRLLPLLFNLGFSSNLFNLFNGLFSA